MRLSRLLALCCGPLLFSLALPSGASVYYQAEGALASDFDGDGVVGFSDFLLFARGFNAVSGGPAFDPRLDLNKDSVVNFHDFLRFSSAFGATGDSSPRRQAYTLYILDAGTSTVGVYDLQSHLLEDYLPFRGPTWMEVSPDQRYVYVSEGFGLFVLNASHEVVTSFPLNAPGRMALSPGGMFAYVGEAPNDLIRVVDLMARNITDTLAVGDVPGTMNVSPDGKRLYVLNSTTVSVVDLGQKKEIARMETGGFPGMMALTSDGKRGYYTRRDRAVLGVADLVGLAVVGEIELTGQATNGVAFSPDGRLFACTTTELLEVDSKRNLVVRSLRVGEDTSFVGVTPDGSTAYVGALEPNALEPGVAVVDLTAWKIRGRIRGFIFPALAAFRASSTP